MKNLLQEWVIDADNGNLDGVDVDLMVRSEEALANGIVILTAEEAALVCDSLIRCTLMSSKEHKLFNKIKELIR